MKPPAVILAGGKSRRMGGADKAELRLGGCRLVDRVAALIAPQTGRVLISGRSDYGLGLPVIADAAELGPGPSAGVFSASAALARQFPEQHGFITVPVDGPFAPTDLVERLGAVGASAIAADDAGRHPTFAFWRHDDLALARRALGDGSAALKKLAETVGARKVAWPGESFFRNINSPEDLAAAEAALQRPTPRGNKP